MGRFLKIAKSLGGSLAQAVEIPSGSSAARPLTPKSGAIRFNTETAQIELFNGSAFVTQAKVGEVTLTIDKFTGDGTTTTFTMAQEPSHAKQIMVFIGSVFQDYTTAYTILEDDITFTSAPPTGETINVIHGIGSTDTA